VERTVDGQHGAQGMTGRRLPPPGPSSASGRSPFTTAGFARMVERAAVAAALELKAHPPILRHARGYALANKGHDTRAIRGWLGHRSIMSAAIYMALAPNRFQGVLAGLIVHFTRSPVVSRCYLPPRPPSTSDHQSKIRLMPHRFAS
jgi:hypothetical protein